MTIRHDNKKQVQSRLRLVGSMCKWRARARILRIGICRSEQKRSCGAKTADYRDKRDKSLLREDHSGWLSTPMRSVQGVRSDHRKPDGNYRAAIIPAKNQFGYDGCAAKRGSATYGFLFSLSNSLVREAARLLSRSDAFHFPAAASRNAARRFSSPE